MRRIKAEVVAGDEREAEGRALLNYGHTLGARARDGGPLRPASRRGGRHRAGVRGRGRPSARSHRRRPGRGAPRGRRVVRPSRVSCPRAPTRDELITLMGRDKKALGAVTFVLDGPRGARGRARRRARRARRGIGGTEMTARKTKLERRGAAVGAEPEPARAARAADLRHGDARRPRRDLPRRGREARPHARARAVEPRGRARRRDPRRSGTSAPRSSSTPARSATTPGRSTTRS